MNELKGEIRALDARVGRFESKVEGELSAVRTGIRRLDEKMMDETQRVAVIEEEMRELEAGHQAFSCIRRYRRSNLCSDSNT